MAAQCQVGGPIHGIRRNPACEKKVREAVVVELPEGFVVGDQARQISAELRVAGLECRSNQASESRLVLLYKIIEARLHHVVKVERSASRFRDRNNKAELLLFARAEFHLEHQHSIMFHSIGSWMES